MSSHREAPEIAKDPVADSTDLYAFVSPDDPDTVTLIANYIPLQSPDGGPNFFEFGDDVFYQIHIDNNGDGSPDVTYQFQFRSVNTIPSTFLYNDGPIESLTSKELETDVSWTRRHAPEQRQERGSRPRRALPTVQHRTVVDPELREPGQVRGSLDVRRTSRVRGSARRGVLR